MTYVAAPDRYERMPYRRTGRSGLKLPVVSLGLWNNFGADRPLETSRAIVRRAFDLGITHFDLANNYGPPYGSAEETFGRLLASDLAPYRDELVDLDEGRLRHVARPVRRVGLAQVPAREPRPEPRAGMGLDYVDIFYSHRLDPETPLEETMGALDAAVRQGKALYAGISSYSPEETREAAAILSGLGTPLLIHQPSYSMLNRWIEDGLLDVLGELGVGCIGFSPLAQGLLTDRYADGDPRGLADRPRPLALAPTQLTDADAGEDRRASARSPPAAARRSPQMALAWTLRDPRMTSTLVGASSVEQLEAERRRARAARLHGRRARRDRPLRDRERHQPLGAGERGVAALVLTRASAAALPQSSDATEEAPRAACSARRSALRERGPRVRRASARSRGRTRAGSRRAGAAALRGRRGSTRTSRPAAPPAPRS